jgi:plasmid stabilization system protein ParE
VSRPIRFEREAQRDLDRLADFLDAASPSAAVRTAHEISSSIRALRQFPERGARVTDRIRQLVILFGDSGYVAQYRIDPDAIVIARVFHMREDR